MPLLDLSCLTLYLALAAAPASAVPTAPLHTRPHVRPRADSTVVTQRDTTQPVLTTDGLARVTRFVTLYLKNPPTVRDSASMYRMIIPLPSIVVNGAPPFALQEISMADMIAMAKTNATVRSNFTASGLTPEEYVTYRRALIVTKALYRADYVLNKDAGAFDVTTTVGKNALFFKQHLKEISALRGAGFSIPQVLQLDQLLSAKAAASPRQSTPASIFAPLDLSPKPSAMRLATGAPGLKYWQNRADVDLKATLDTATQTVRGAMTLRYTNNSPDVLHEMWFQTEQVNGVIDQFDQVVGGRPVPLTQENPGGDTYEMRVALAEPLRPGKTATFKAEWHFQIPDGGGLRMGRDGTLYEVAQWYPRPAVYDDVKGWNTESYETSAEFYLEYGDYSLEVTAPAGYVVAATGTLDNPKDVLTETQIGRLALAAKSDTVVRVITAAELASGAARPTRQGMLTWKFHAKNVRDAAWAAAPNYQWDAMQWRGILAQSYYRPSSAANWSDAADQARMSIQEYSERWFPYPYPQISAVEGPVPGMEYPMLAMEANPGDQSALYSVVTHEVGHNWFPMIVGSNERMHAWMDEGFNTFINSFSEARRYPASGDQAVRVDIAPFNGSQATIETGNPTGNSEGAQYFGTAQRLQMLRRDVLGPAVFDSAFRTYIRRWAYKHPTPMDFFRTMENISGRKLDWFWRQNFYESPHFDQAIDSIAQTADGTKARVTVWYGNKGRAVFPLLVRFKFTDGTTRDVTYPVDVWQTNPATYSTSDTFDQKVSAVIIDPDRHLPDANRGNNNWTAP